MVRRSVNNGTVHFDEDELLSAYLDGEVTEAERAAVEARLARDPVARALLEELRTLSNSLHSLPRDPAPAELQAAALQGLVNRPSHSVANSQQSTHAVPVTAHRVKWFRRRELFAGATAIAATVLVVALLPWTMSNPLESDSDHLRMLTLNSTESTASRGTSFELSETDRLGVKFQERGAETADGAQETVAFSTEMGRNAPSFAADPIVIAAAARLPELATAKAGEALRDNNTKAWADEVAAAEQVDALVRLEPWQEIQPYLNLINQNSGVVTNFDMHVLDTVQAADQFQVLLLQNGMAVTDAEIDRAAGQTVAGSKSRRHSPSFGIEPVLVGVYIEADDTEPVTKSLETLARQNTLVGLKLQPPLQMPEDVVTNSVGQPGQRRSSKPADEQLANGLIDAYIDVQYNMAVSDVVSQAPVSALAALPGAQELTRLGEGLNELPATEPSPSRAMAGKDSQEAKSTTNRRQEVPVARYSQIVKVPQPVDWYAELQEEQQKTSGEAAADLAFTKRLNNRSDSEETRLMQMKRELQANSSGRYRLFFVLKPSNTVAGPEKAAKPDDQQ